MDHLAYRKKLGTLGPSTNTIVQPDFDDLRPVGVTNHYSRIAIPNDPVTDDASFLKLVNSINQATMDAVDVLRSCEMDYLVMGMSAATFWNGRQGAGEYLKMMQDRAQVGVSCGSFATEAALNVYKAKLHSGTRFVFAASQSGADRPHHRRDVPQGDPAA
jgi:maleate isomerase